MSVNNRYGERKFNSLGNDRISHVLSQPVQAWEKKWVPSSRSKHHQIYKWVKADRTLMFEDEDEDEDDDDDDDDTDQAMAKADEQDTPLATAKDSTAATTTQQVATETNIISNANPLAEGIYTATSASSSPPEKLVPVTTVDETRAPKLSDIPDVDLGQTLINNPINKDASQHPAFEPHAHSTDLSCQPEEQQSSLLKPDEQDSIMDIDSVEDTTNKTMVIDNMAGPSDVNSSSMAITVPVASAPPMAPSVVETEPSPIIQHDQELRLHQNIPTEKKTSLMDDTLLDTSIQTPDAVSSTNTPGVDSPFNTPSDIPMQTPINVVNNDSSPSDHPLEGINTIMEPITDVEDTT